MSEPTERQQDLLTRAAALLGELTESGMSPARIVAELEMRGFSTHGGGAKRHRQEQQQQQQSALLCLPCDVLAIVLMNCCAKDLGRLKCVASPLRGPRFGSIEVVGVIGQSVLSRHRLRFCAGKMEREQRSIAWALHRAESADNTFRKACSAIEANEPPVYGFERRGDGVWDLYELCSQHSRSSSTTAADKGAALIASDPAALVEMLRVQTVPLSTRMALAVLLEHIRSCYSFGAHSRSEQWATASCIEAVMALRDEVLDCNEADFLAESSDVWLRHRPYCKVFRKDYDMAYHQTISACLGILTAVAISTPGLARNALAAMMSTADKAFPIPENDSDDDEHEEGDEAMSGMADDLADIARSSTDDNLMFDAGATQWLADRLASHYGWDWSYFTPFAMMVESDPRGKDYLREQDVLERAFFYAKDMGEISNWAAFARISTVLATDHADSIAKLIRDHRMLAPLMEVCWRVFDELAAGSSSSSPSSLPTADEGAEVDQLSFADDPCEAAPAVLRLIRLLTSASVEAAQAVRDTALAQLRACSAPVRCCPRDVRFDPFSCSLRGDQSVLEQFRLPEGVGIYNYHVVLQVRSGHLCSCVTDGVPLRGATVSSECGERPCEIELRLQDGRTVALYHRQFNSRLQAGRQARMRFVRRALGHAISRAAVECAPEGDGSALGAHAQMWLDWIGISVDDAV